MMDQKETVLRWESKRWSDFQKNLEQINQNNSFQRARFRELSDWKSWSGFEEFSKICPLTTKQEIENDRVSNPQHGSNLTYPIEKYLRFSRTSGTSGDPITWMDTQKDWKWMLGNWDRILEEGRSRSGSSLFLCFFFWSVLRVLDGLRSGDSTGMCMHTWWWSVHRIKVGYNRGRGS